MVDHQLLFSGTAEEWTVTLLTSVIMSLCPSRMLVADMICGCTSLFSLYLCRGPLMDSGPKAEAMNNFIFIVPEGRLCRMRVFESDLDSLLPSRFQFRVLREQKNKRNPGTMRGGVGGCIGKREPGRKLDVKTMFYVGVCMPMGGNGYSFGAGTKCKTE